MPLLIGVRLAFFAVLALVSFLSVVTVPHDMGTGWDKLNHLYAFLALLLLMDYAYPRFDFWRQKIVLIFAYGLLIECVQYFIPAREFSLLDIFADSLGMAIYIVLRNWLHNFLPLIKQTG